MSFFFCFSNFAQLNRKFYLLFQKKKNHINYNTFNAAHSPSTKEGNKQSPDEKLIVLIQYPNSFTSVVKQEDRTIYSP